MQLKDVGTLNINFCLCDVILIIQQPMLILQETQKDVTHMYINCG